MTYVSKLQDLSSFWTGTEDLEAQKRVFYLLAKFTEHFLHSLRNTASDLEITGSGDGDELTSTDSLEIGEDTLSIKEVLEIVHSDVVMKGIKMSSPTFFGLIPGCGHLLYSAASFISTLIRDIPSTRFVNSGCCDLENIVIKWACGIVGYKDFATGVMVSGTSMGSLVAFATARDHLLESSRQFDRAVVYMTENVHECHLRTLRITGLGQCVYRFVSSHKHSMIPEDLENTIMQDKKSGLIPFLVIGSLGTGAIGATDPFDAVSEVTKKYNIWYHIDAAYGGFLMLNDAVKNKCKGIDRADSLTMNCHKGLSAPFGTGILLMKNGDKLRAAMLRSQGDMLYTAGESGYDPIDLSFEMSRPFRSFPVWFALKVLGTDVFKSQIEEMLILTKHAYNRLSEMANVMVYTEPELTIIAFRITSENKEDGNSATRHWLQLINKDGHICMTSTTIDGLVYIRMCILSLRTHLRDVNATLQVIQRTLKVIIKHQIINSESLTDCVGNDYK